MRFKWLLFAAVIFLGIGLFLLQLFGPSAGARLGHKTTVITSPLASDGLPNYAQAIVDELSQGVTRDNNAARDMWQAVGRGDVLREEDFKLLCRALDVPVSVPPKFLEDPQTKAVRERLKEWLDTLHGPDTIVAYIDRGASDATNASATDELGNAVEFMIDDEVTRLAWTAADYPPLGDWATANAAPMDLLVSASAKPKFYSPPPNFLTKPDEPLVQMLLPHVQATRSVARALTTRAMLRAGNKQYAESWQDCLACWRWGGLAASGPTLIDKLVGMAIRGMAKNCTLGLLQCDDLPESVARQILDDLNALPSEVPIVDSMDKAERYMFLDTTLRLLTNRLGGIDAGDLGGNSSFPVGVFGFDVSIPLEIGNEWYDRLVTAVQMEDREARLQEFKRIDEEVMKMTRNLKSGLAGGVFSRRARSELIGEYLVGQFLPAMNAATEAVERDATNLTLTRVAAALALFRARRHAYPERLDELTPDILATVPGDLYAGHQALHYDRRGDGYVLYSVFKDGADDGGDDYFEPIKDGEWLPVGQSAENDHGHSDLVIRMPRPARKLAAVKVESEDAAVDGVPAVGAEGGNSEASKDAPARADESDAAPSSEGEK